MMEIGQKMNISCGNHTWFEAERLEDTEEDFRFIVKGFFVDLVPLLAGHYKVSRSQVREWIRQNGVKLNGNTVHSSMIELEDGGTGIIQIGKRRFVRVSNGLS